MRTADQILAEFMEQVRAAAREQMTARQREIVKQLNGEKRKR